MAAIPEVLLSEIFRKLRLREPLSGPDVETLSAPEVTPAQQCSILAALVLRHQLSPEESELLRNLGQRHPRVVAALGQDAVELHSSNPQPTPEDAHWLELFHSIRTSRSLRAESVRRMLHDLVSTDDVDELAAAWLMTVCISGMSHDNTILLTESMTETGPRFDYRKDARLASTRLIRRYPTGALSEKAALILPALIATARNRVAVCSPFLVARSLGPTGGTWDKLSAVPGFEFPEPGDQSVELLASCGVAMTVTKGSANPADRRLYQLRSITGTIESVPLIVASIASKQLTFPVHRLLLDVRYGDGAFLRHQSDGLLVSREIAGILETENIGFSYTLTATSQPNGIAVGNALEVAEAIAVMGGPAERWDERALLEQRLLVIDFFSKLMAAEFPSITASSWARFASEAFRQGKVLHSFADILIHHKVPRITAEDILKDPWTSLGISPEALTVSSVSGGTLRRIEQFKLGEIVNRTLGGGANEFEGTFDASAGIVLGARIGDVIHPGGSLCRVHTRRQVSTEIVSEIAKCFEVSA